MNSLNPTQGMLVVLMRGWCKHFCTVGREMYRWVRGGWTGPVVGVLVSRETERGEKQRRFCWSKEKKILEIFAGSLRKVFQLGCVRL